MTSNMIAPPTTGMATSRRSRPTRIGRVVFPQTLVLPVRPIFFLLSEMATAEARAARHPKTAEVLLGMARAYLERARALGWEPGVKHADDSTQGRNGQAGIRFRRSGPR
jgi:hypothetical protein